MVDRRPAWFAVRSRKPGPLRAGLEAIALDRVDLDPVLLEMARSTADLADSAKRAQDPRLWLSASGRLMVLMGRLGVSDDGDPAPAGGADDIPDLADVVGSAPEVRDVAESRPADLRGQDRGSR